MIETMIRQDESPHSLMWQCSEKIRGVILENTFTGLADMTEALWSVWQPLSKLDSQIFWLHYSDMGGPAATRIDQAVFQRPMEFVRQDR